MRSAVPFAPLELIASHFLITAPLVIECIVIDMLPDVPHGLKHRKRGIECRDGPVYLDPCRRHLSRQLSRPAQSSQSNYKKLKIGPIAEEKHLIFGLGGAHAPTL